MQTTDAQVRKLMKEYKKTGKVGESALRSGMSRNTAAKYVKSGKLPSELKSPRTWRTRPDPFEKEWPEIEQRVYRPVENRGGWRSKSAAPVS